MTCASGKNAILSLIIYVFVPDFFHTWVMLHTPYLPWVSGTMGMGSWKLRLRLSLEDYFVSCFRDSSMMFGLNMRIKTSNFNLFLCFSSSWVNLRLHNKNKLCTKYVWKFLKFCVGGWWRVGG